MTSPPRVDDPRFYTPSIRITPTIYRIPVFGKWAQRIGQVGYMMTVPCDTTGLMWIEGFFFNIPKLCWSLISPDINDVIVNRAGKRHGKKRRFSFQMEQYIEAEDNGIELPGYGRWLFRLGSLAQRIGWWFLIIDAGTEFLVNWMSTVYEYAGCDTGQGPWYSSNANSTVGPSPHPQRILWGRNSRGNGHLLAPGGSGVLVLNSMDAAGVGFSIDAKVWPLAGPPVATIDAWIVNSQGEVFARTGPSALAADGRQKTASFHQFSRPLSAWEEYQVWMMVSNGYAILDDSTISVVTGPSYAIKPGMSL